MTEKKTNVVPYYTSMFLFGAIIGMGWVVQSANDKRIAQLEKQVEFFQKLWDNVPEEYRREVSP